MTEDRRELEKLQEKREQINRIIKEITVHPSGKTYGKMISNLIYECLNNSSTNKLPTYNGKWNKKYAVYSKMHAELTKELGIKTQTFTKQEYIKALNIIKKKYNYSIPEKYNI